MVAKRKTPGRCSTLPRPGYLASYLGTCAMVLLALQHWHVINHEGGYGLLSSSPVVKDPRADLASRLEASEATARQLPAELQALRPRANDTRSFVGPTNGGAGAAPRSENSAAGMSASNSRLVSGGAMTTALVPIPQSSVTNAPPGSRPAADPTPVATVAVAKNAPAAVAGAAPSRRAVRLFLPGDVVPPNLRDFACALRRSPRAPKPKPARGGAAIVGWSTTAAAAPVTATARPELTSSCEAPCGDDACTAAVAQCEALLECRAVVVRPQQSPPPSRHGASGRGGNRDGNPGGSRGGQSFNASAPGAVARLAAVLKASSLADDSLALLATSRWWGSPALGLPPPPALSASRSGARSARSSNGGGGGGGAAASSAATGAAGLGVGEARSRLYIVASYGGCGSKMVAAWLKALPKKYQKCVAHFPMYPWCLFGLQPPVCVCFAPLRIARYVFHVHDRSPPRNLWRMPVPKVLGSRLSGVAHQRPPPSGNPPRRPKAGVHGGAGDARASSFKGDATFKRDGDLVRRSSGHRREKGGNS